MLRKLMIAPYFGGLPPWYDKYLANTNRLRPYGWDFLTFPDESDFKLLVAQNLGVNIFHLELARCRKVTDFFPMFGAIFKDYLRNYNYWGHCGLDQIYGDVPDWCEDAELEECLIWSNDPGTICGPFTVYRNTPDINNLFMREPDWKGVLTSNVYHAYDEGGFSQLVRRKLDPDEISYHFLQGSNLPGTNLEHDGKALFEDGKEIMMFHFNKTQEWPLK
jgi:hypothetical protein